MNQYKKGVIYTIIGGACWGISGTCGEYLCTFKGMDTRLLTDIDCLGRVWFCVCSCFGDIARM
ncbi:MAG: hypothetical protein ACLTDV_07120 [Eubacterium sp.]